MSNTIDAPDSDMGTTGSYEGPATDKEEMHDRQTDWIAELQEKREFAILEMLITKPAMPPATVVEKLVELTLEHAVDEKELGDHCWHTACSVIEITSRTPSSQQQPIIDFVHQLKATNVNNPRTGEGLKYDGLAVWNELPTFADTIADEFASFSGGDDHPIAELQRWENLFAFFAQLDASTEGTELDFSTSYAATIFGWGFDDDSGTRPSRIALRAACLWAALDADKMRRKILSGLYERFQQEHWDAWKECIVNERADADETTRELIDKALRELNRAEEEIFL